MNLHELKRKVELRGRIYLGGSTIEIILLKRKRAYIFLKFFFLSFFVALSGLREDCIVVVTGRSRFSNMVFVYWQYDVGFVLCTGTNFIWTLTCSGITWPSKKVFFWIIRTGAGAHLLMSVECVFARTYADIHWINYDRNNNNSISDSNKVKQRRTNRCRWKQNNAQHKQNRRNKTEGIKNSKRGRK